MSITVTPNDTSARFADASSRTEDREVQADWSVPVAWTADASDQTFFKEDALEEEETGSYPEDIARRIQRPVPSVPPPIRLSDRRVQLLQQWECVVHSVADGLVTCELHDLTVESEPMEIAEIYLEEFSDFDKPLLKEGTVFYWSVGRETSSAGQVRRYSELRVRRVPALTRSRRNVIASHAKELDAFFHRCREQNAAPDA